MKITSIKDLDLAWNETKFTDAMRDACAYFRGYSLKLGAGQFMARGTPDTIYFVAGVSFMLESKVHPYKVQPIQLEQLKNIRNGTGSAWAVTLIEFDGQPSIDMDDGQRFFSINDLFMYCVKYAKEKARTCEFRFVQ